MRRVGGCTQWDAVPQNWQEILKDKKLAHGMDQKKYGEIVQMWGAERGFLFGPALRLNWDPSQMIEAKNREIAEMLRIQKEIVEESKPLHSGKGIDVRGS